MATIIVDQTTGKVTIEGLDAAQVREIAGDLLDDPQLVNCGRPLDEQLVELPEHTQGSGVLTYVHRIWHGDITSGPGRRSVVQFQGCPIRCPGCYVPETHSAEGGSPLYTSKIFDVLTSPFWQRDGVTILGGEPFAQPHALANLVMRLYVAGQNVTVYSGYTLQELVARRDPDIDTVLNLVDFLIDGPYRKDMAVHPGEWRGSINQVIRNHAEIAADIAKMDRFL